MQTYIVSLLLTLVLSYAGYAQESPLPIGEVTEDNLGNVTDAFQEHFFEALKQKAIENYEKAVTSLRRCEELEPENPVVHYELGKTFALMEKHEDAIVSFQKANRLKPGQQWVLVNLMESYYANKEFEQAIIVAKNLVPIDSQYYNNLADLYFKAGKYEELLTLLDKLDAALGVTEFRLGLRQQIYALTNNTPAQIEVIKDAIKASPDSESNYLNLIFVYSEHNMEKEAFEAAREMRKIFPSSTVVHLALYKFYLNNMETDRAMESMKIVFKAEEIDATSKFKVLNDFLLFVTENGQYEEDLKEVISLFSDTENSSEVYQKLGEYFLLKNDKSQALNYFEQGIKTEMDNFELLRNTLLLQLDLGKYEAAESLSEEAMEIFPAQPILYLVRGAALNEQQKFSDAAEILTFGLDYVLEPMMNADFYRQLATAYTGLGNSAKAAEYIKMAEVIK